MSLTRLDIYTRLKVICETHTGARHEYELNTNNLMKGDIQRGSIQRPEFFYSERWRELGLNPESVCKDFPLVFLSPGSRTLERSNFDNGYSLATFEFNLLVFDLMNYDRNNLSGNETALRERERIWFDTENILMDIMQAGASGDL